MAAFEELPLRRVIVSALLTIAAYWILTGYDHLAMRYIGRNIGYGKVGFAAFVGYAFSNSVGHSFLTGGSVRFRLYTAWGLSPLEIAKVVAFSHLTFYIGMLMLIGLACVLEPQAIAQMSGAPQVIVQPLGGAMIGVVIVYFIWVSRRRAPVRIRRWEFPPPSPGLSLAQLVVATLDLALMAAVLYALLPDMPGRSFTGFLGLFMVAQVVGVGSQVPGGLGVFETIMLHILKPDVPPVEALSALLAYRIMYYLVPLALAAAMLGTYEIRARRAS